MYTIYEKGDFFKKEKKKHDEMNDVNKNKWKIFKIGEKLICTVFLFEWTFVEFLHRFLFNSAGYHTCISR